MAAEKPGWRDRVVKASAQVNLASFDGAAALDGVFGCLLVLVGRGQLAATNLQKSVLVGLDRHWAQVPGPLMQGSESPDVPLIVCCPSRLRA